MALIPAVCLYLSNLHSINFALETHVFIASMILTSVILFKKIKNMKIVYKKDHLGFAWPDNFNRFVNLITFSALVSIIAVWGTLEINQVFDKSNPKEITGKIMRKVKSKEIIRTSFKLRIKPDLPEMKKSTTLRVDSDLYENINKGSTVALVIKDGALGYPYIAEVRPYKLNENPKGTNEYGQ